MCVSFRSRSRLHHHSSLFYLCCCSLKIHNTKHIYLVWPHSLLASLSLCPFYVYKMWFSVFIGFENISSCYQWPFAICKAMVVCCLKYILDVYTFSCCFVVAAVVIFLFSFTLFSHSLSSSLRFATHRQQKPNHQTMEKERKRQEALKWNHFILVFEKKKK